jgi:hypothetical protein
MKLRWSFRLSLAFLAIAVCAAVSPVQCKSREKPRIAVLDVQVAPELQTRERLNLVVDRIIDAYATPSEARSNRESLYAKVSDVKLDTRLATELLKIYQVRAVTARQGEATMRRNKLSLTGAPDKATAVRIGKTLGVNYLFASQIKELNVRKEGAGTLVFSMTASPIDTLTGEVLWTGEASHDEVLVLSGPGSSNAAAEQKALDIAMDRVVQKLVASARDATLFS